MQITCKSRTEAKCPGPSDSVAGVRKWGPRWGTVPGTRGALHICLWWWARAEDGTGADGGAAPRDQSSPSCCHSGLPSPVTSFPKEPAEWPEMRADHDGGSRSRDQGGAAGGTGRSLSGSPSPSQIPPGKPPSFIPPPLSSPPPLPPEAGAAQPCFFVCFLYVCLLPSPASSARPP